MPSASWPGWACSVAGRGRHPHARADLRQPVRPEDMDRTARPRRRARCAAVQHPPRQAARGLARGGGRASHSRPYRLPFAGFQRRRAGRHGPVRGRPGRARRRRWSGQTASTRWCGRVLPGRGRSALDRRHALARRGGVAGVRRRADDADRRRDAGEIRAVSDLCRPRPAGHAPDQLGGACADRLGRAGRRHGARIGAGLASRPSCCPSCRTISTWAGSGSSTRRR